MKRKRNLQRKKKSLRISSLKQKPFRVRQSAKLGKRKNTKMNKTQLTTPLPVPGFFNPNRKKEIYIIDRGPILSEALENRKRFEAKVTSQRPKIVHAGIDWQITFGPFPGATLPVLGSEDDAVRVAKWMYQWGHVINQCHFTLDTHYTWQLFHPLFLVDEKGNPPPIGVPIPDADIKAGKFKVRLEAANAWFDNSAGYMWLMSYMRHYSAQLATSPRQYPFIPWPFHAQLGNVEHALFPLLAEAVFYWEVMGAHNFTPWIKGDGSSEAYSPLGAEVKAAHDGTAVGQLNADFLKLLLESDAVIITGQAKSHCVRAFIGDVLDDIRKKDPKLAEKIYLVEDGTSPVVIPGVIDFTNDANKAFAEFQSAGMKAVRTTTPLPEWPGMDRILNV